MSDIQAKTELILRGHNFVRRTIETTEEILGDATILLSKHAPRPVNFVKNVFSVDWRSIRASCHMLFRGEKAYVIVEAPTYGPRCTWKPVFQNGGNVIQADWKTMTKEKKEEVLSKVDNYVSGWRPDFSNPAPQVPFDKMAQLNFVPNTELGTMMFIVSFTEYSTVGSTYLKLKEYVLGDCYMVYMRKSDSALLPLFLTNHYESGIVCMGGDFRDRIMNGNKRGAISELTQDAVNSYNTTLNNTDLRKNGMEDAWTVNYDMSESKLSPGTRFYGPTSLAFLEGIV
jgi:hypothetical protein